MPTLAPQQPLTKPRTQGHVTGVLPGLALCLVVTALALTLERAEAAAFGDTWLEALVLAILVGTVVRTAWTPGSAFTPGIAFSAKLLLEIAVVLLGLSISARMIAAAGPLLVLGIAGLVVFAIAASYGIGRALRLPHQMALLVACGNSICGNSAIAAVAPVIGADGEDVASSIAFTAVLGVLVVLSLPLAATALHMSALQGGVLAGLTVYAVPQVLAAAAPMGAAAVQMGTLVKLVRVLMLGLAVLTLSLMTRPMRDETDEVAPHLTAGDRPKPGRLPLHKMVPWFIAGFLVLGGLRSAGLVPAAVLAPAATAANALTIISMAALGLGTDLRTVAGAGPRVIAAVIGSLVVLAGVSLLLIRLSAIG